MTSPPFSHVKCLKQGQKSTLRQKREGHTLKSVLAKEELLYHTSAFCRSYSTRLDTPQKKKGEVKNEMGATSIIVIILLVSFPSKVEGKEQ